MLGFMHGLYVVPVRAESGGVAVYSIGDRAAREKEISIDVIAILIGTGGRSSSLGPQIPSNFSPIRDEVQIDTRQKTI